MVIALRDSRQGVEGRHTALPETSQEASPSLADESEARKHPLRWLQGSSVCGNRLRFPWRSDRDSSCCNSPSSLFNRFKTSSAGPGSAEVWGSISHSSTRSLCCFLEARGRRVELGTRRRGTSGLDRIIQVADDLGVNDRLLYHALPQVFASLACQTSQSLPSHPATARSPYAAAAPLAPGSRRTRRGPSQPPFRTPLPRSRPIN